MSLDKIEAVKKLVSSAGSQIFSVTFTKKDGTSRVMQVQQAAIVNRLVGDAASESAKKATVTRKERHPNLIAVFDIGKGQIRSINAETVDRVVIRGKEHLF